MRALSLLLLGVALALACTRAPSARRSIGVSLPATGGVFYQEVERGMRQVNDSLGFDLRVTTGDGPMQASQVDSFVRAGVVAIVLGPADPERSAGAIERANRARVPVFTVGVRAEGGEVVSHIGSDDGQGGELASWYLGQRLHGGGNEAILDQPSVATIRERVAGFRLVLSRFPNIRILATPAVEPGTREQAQRATEHLLAADQRIDAIFATTDECALGALAAIEAAHRTDVVVVGDGGSAEARAAIAKHTALVADVVPDPVTMGRYAIEIAASHLRGNRVYAFAPVRVRVVDIDSLEAPGPGR